MGWDLDLSFNTHNKLIGSVTPPNNYYYKGAIHMVDINSSYLDGITLYGYQDGDYIAVLMVEYDCSIGNSGSIEYAIDLWEDLEGSGYAFVVVYDNKEKEGVRDIKTGKKVTNQL